MYAKAFVGYCECLAGKYPSARIMRMTALCFRSIALIHHAGMKASALCIVRRPRPISGIPELCSRFWLIEH